MRCSHCLFTRLHSSILPHSPLSPTTQHRASLCFLPHSPYLTSFSPPTPRPSVPKPVIFLPKKFSPLLTRACRTLLNTYTYIQSTHIHYQSPLYHPVRSSPVHPSFPRITTTLYSHSQRGLHAPPPSRTYAIVSHFTGSALIVCICTPTEQ